jgi:hypothetical protein
MEVALQSDQTSQCTGVHAPNTGSFHPTHFTTSACWCNIIIGTYYGGRSLAAIPIIISLFSLAKSYESNRIAEEGLSKSDEANRIAEEALSIKRTDHEILEKASSSNVTMQKVPDDFHSGYGYKGIIIRDMFRLRNGGGVPATIDGFGIRVIYGDHIDEILCVENPVWGYCALYGLPKPFDRVVVYIIPDYEKDNEPDDLPHDFSLDYPHKLDAYTSEDYFVEITVITIDSKPIIEYDIEFIGLISYNDGLIIELDPMYINRGIYDLPEN